MHIKLFITINNWINNVLWRALDSRICGKLGTVLCRNLWTSATQPVTITSATWQGQNWIVKSITSFANKCRKTATRYPLIMPRTKRQYMKYQRFLCLGFEESIFCIGVLGVDVLSLAFYHDILQTEWINWTAKMECCHNTHVYNTQVITNIWIEPAKRVGLITTYLDDTDYWHKQQEEWLSWLRRSVSALLFLIFPGGAAPQLAPLGGPAFWCCWYKELVSYIIMSTYWVFRFG